MVSLFDPLTANQTYNEKELLFRLSGDDSEIFTYLFNEYFIPLCFFAQKLTASKEEAEDIAIDTLRKFWVVRKNFAALAAIKSFLYITTRNACLNYLQRRQRETARNKDFTDANSQEEEDIESLLIKAEVIGRLYDEVQSLPPKCRNVFELVLQGLSTREIAQKLQITELNVRSQKKRAIQLLRAVFLHKKLLLFFFLWMKK